MSGVALIGATLAALILIIFPSVLSLQLSGSVLLFWVLLSLFAGVLVFNILQN